MMHINIREKRVETILSLSFAVWEKTDIVFIQEI